MTMIIDCPPSTRSSHGLELEGLKAKQQATWTSGDYAVIGTSLQLVGESLCEAADVAAGETVLDVACGNGNATLAAARRYARVTGVDYVPELLSRAQARANAERLALQLKCADAEALPFRDATFDVVLSTFGVMFTANHEQAARELLRVCKPGGRIALANWTPEGFLGELFRTLTRHVPPPPGAPSALRWGTRRGLDDLFADGASAFQIERKLFNFRFLSAAHFIDVFRTVYGPVLKAFGALDAAGQAALAADMEAALRKFDRGGGSSLIVPAEYLEVVIRRA